MSTGNHVSLLFHRVNNITVRTHIVDGLCIILVILGIIGNVLGLFIFSSSRRTWRISSVYACLATSSSLTNVLCIIRYVFVLHSSLRNFLYELVGEKWWACKFYELTYSCRIISSWITLFWMSERLMCVSNKLRTCCNQCNAWKLKFIIPSSVLIIIICGVVGPPVYMYKPVRLDPDLIDPTIYTNKTYCELDPNASIKWKKYFHEVKFMRLNHFTVRCFFSEIFPTGAIVLFNCYILYHIIRTHHYLHQKNDYQPQRESMRTTLWMNIVLLLHTSLFLVSLISHIIGHFTVDEAHEAWWVLLAVLMNSSLNFYIYCLSGKAFRNEIRRFIQRIIQKFDTQQYRDDRWLQNPDVNHPETNSPVFMPLKKRHNRGELDK